MKRELKIIYNIIIDVLKTQQPTNDKKQLKIMKY